MQVYRIAQVVHGGFMTTCVITMEVTIGVLRLRGDGKITLIDLQPEMCKPIVLVVGSTTLIQVTILPMLHSLSK